MALQIDAITLDQLTSDPVSPPDGCVWFNTTEQKLKVCRNSAVEVVDSVKNNYGATTNPGASDDSTAGYEVGSQWINTTTDVKFVCMNASAAAAVWEKLATDKNAIHDDTAGELAAVALKGTPAGADILLIEDSADSNNKKRITVGTLPTGGGGEANTSSNAGAGEGTIAKAKVGIDLPFKSLKQGDGITITNNADDVEIAATGSDPTAGIVTATGDTTTTSATDVLVNAMTVTPPSGTYLVWFSGSVDHSANNSTADMSIYVGGSKDADSERRFKRGSSQGDISTPFTCIGKVTVNGSQAIEGKWRTSGATATMHERNLTYLQVA